MDDQGTNRARGGVNHKGITIAMAIALMFFAVPFLCVVFYGGGAAALGGMMIIAAMIAIQYPLMRLLVRRKK